HAGRVLVGHEEEDAPAVADVPFDVRPEVAIDEVREVLRSLERDPELLADDAVDAVRRHDRRAADRVLLARRLHEHLDRGVAFRLPHGLRAMPEAQIDEAGRARGVAEDLLHQVLRGHDGQRRAHVGPRSDEAVRLDASQLLADDAPQEADGALPALRRVDAAQALVDGPTPAARDLHGARVHVARLRMPRRRVALLEQYGSHAETCQLERRGQPHRAAADDDDRLRRCHASCVKPYDGSGDAVNDRGIGHRVVTCPSRRALMSIHFRSEGPVAIVTIDRPDVANAIDRPTAEALADAFRRFDADDSLHVAVLTGAHGTFCAGADLKAMREPGMARASRLDREGDGPVGPTRMLLAKPVIAAVEGHAVAGGIELAAWCDLRVAADDAIFGVYCRRWGIPLMDGGTFRLARLIGHSHALDLILTGRGVSGEEALRMGLAN